jgi:hypothetical protein
MDNMPERIHLSFLNLFSLILVIVFVATDCFVNPLTPELNPSAQRSLTSFFTGDFAS